MTSKTLIGSVFALSSLALTTVALSADTSGHPGTAKEDMSYQGAPIAMDPSAAKDLIGGEGPPIRSCQADLFRALRRLPRRPTQGRHG